MGKNSCCTRLETQVQISSTHVEKLNATVHTDSRSPSAVGAEAGEPLGLADCQPCSRSQ